MLVSGVKGTKLAYRGDHYRNHRKHQYSRSKSSRKHSFKSCSHHSKSRSSSHKHRSHSRSSHKCSHSKSRSVIRVIVRSHSGGRFCNSHKKFTSIKRCSSKRFRSFSHKRSSSKKCRSSSRRHRSISDRRRRSSSRRVGYWRNRFNRSGRYL